jgi:hypothetical protein
MLAQLRVDESPVIFAYCVDVALMRLLVYRPCVKLIANIIGPFHQRIERSVAGQSRAAEVPKTDGWFKAQFVSFGEFQSTVSWLPGST